MEKLKLIKLKALLKNKQINTIISKIESIYI